VQYRRLGDSDLHVSEIGLGSWLTFGAGIGRVDAEACVEAAFDEGINFIDTANVYGHGAAEELLGEVLRGRPRESYVLATKLYFPMSPTDRGLSREQVHKQLDASLARLRVDYVDLYQCHRYDAETPLEETMEALSEAVRAGKARAIGFSEWSADGIRSSLALSPPNVKFVSSQPQYSLLWREPEREIFPLCAANGISQVVWSPLAQGVLTGKYRPGDRPAADTRMASEEMGWAMGRFTGTDVLLRVQRLGAVAERIGVSTARLALAWVLREPNVSSAIIGASRAEQVRMNAGASGVRLDPETLAEIDGILH
jgi:aryl-alcohol dehydrogenase-like predicted oxidoreductase